MTSKREPKAELLGSLEDQVMLAVVRTGADAYGMSVRRELETVTGRAITIGSVYATLDRLEAKGLVESSRTPAADASASRRISPSRRRARRVARAHARHARAAVDGRQPRALRKT